MNDGRVFDGTGGVHVHMTNSRLTDPEILEMRYPVRLERFALVRGSGGAGQGRGGDGTIRAIRFLEAMDCALLSSHRAHPPRGIAGGGDGQVGETTVTRRSGDVEVLPACVQTRLEAGEVITTRTPTAGGFGAAATAPDL